MWASIELASRRAVALLKGLFKACLATYSLRPCCNYNLKYNHFSFHGASRLLNSHFIQRLQTFRLVRAAYTQEFLGAMTSSGTGNFQTPVPARLFRSIEIVYCLTVTGFALHFFFDNEAEDN